MTAWDDALDPQPIDGVLALADRPYVQVPLAAVSSQWALHARLPLAPSPVIVTESISGTVPLHRAVCGTAQVCPQAASCKGQPAAKGDSMRPSDTRREGALAVRARADHAEVAEVDLVREPSADDPPA